MCTELSKQPDTATVRNSVSVSSCVLGRAVQCVL